MSPAIALEWLQRSLTSPWVHTVALLFLCAAYLQGGFDKIRNFDAARSEMDHFGLRPAAPMALGTIALQWGASALVVTGFYRWLGALALASFTVAAAFMADRFWVLRGMARKPAANAFFEHWGLVGGLLLVAWHDLGGTHATK